MKTSELTGAQLDNWAIKALGEPTAEMLWEFGLSFIGELKPSTAWAHGGPIKERMRIGTYWIEERAQWRAGIDMHGYTPEFNIAEQHGRTELEAAMRCLVASKYGDEVPDSQF